MSNNDVVGITLYDYTVCCRVSLERLIVLQIDIVDFLETFYYS